MRSKSIHINPRTFSITRRFDAPIHLVFNAFTDPEHLIRWWRPKGFTMVFCKLDLRPGGMLHYCAKSPEEKPLWGKFVYREILRDKRIIFVNSFTDEFGCPQEMLNKILFKEEGDTTVVTFASQAMDAPGTLDQLDNYLQTITSKIINHEYK
jgi:uncharacterized protein YndB with AHSA1/START domain